MNLVIRYVEAVKNELPKQNRDDIAKELQSTLEDELEALIEKQGQLSQGQVAAFLEQRGHPVQVASQYWKQRSLISEAVYPLYKQALVFFCSLYLAFGILLNFEDLMITQDWSNKFGHLFFDLLSMVAFAFVVITLVFHFFADEIAQQKWVWKFNATNLPDVGSQAAYISRVESISDVFSNLFGLAFLTFGVVTFHNLDISANLSPISGWLEALRYLLLADLGLNLFNLVQPYWTRAKLLVSTMLSVGMILCLTLIVTMPQVIDISSYETLNQDFLVSLQLSLRITFGVFIVVLLWSVFDTLRRVWKLRLPTI